MTRVARGRREKERRTPRHPSSPSKPEPEFAGQPSGSVLPLCVAPRRGGSLGQTTALTRSRSCLSPCVLCNCEQVPSPDIFYSLNPVWVGGGAAAVPSQGPTEEGCHGWSLGESRAVSVGGGSAFPGLWLRSLLPHGPPCLGTSAPAHACPVPLVLASACPSCPCHLPCLPSLVLLVPACPARTPWTSNPQPLPLMLFIAGRELMDIC